MQTPSCVLAMLGYSTACFHSEACKSSSMVSCLDFAKIADTEYRFLKTLLCPICLMSHVLLLSSSILPGTLHFVCPARWTPVYAGVSTLCMPCLFVQDVRWLTQDSLHAKHPLELGAHICPYVYIYTHRCMHACVHGRMDGWMGGWVDGWMDLWIYGSMDLWIYVSTYLRIYVWMDVGMYRKYSEV